MNTGLADRLQQFQRLLSISRAALRGLTLQSLHLHKATAKLGYIATSIFAGLLQEGFCTTEEAEGEGDGADGGGVFKEAEGTVRADLSISPPQNLTVAWQYKLLIFILTPRLGYP